MKHVDFGFRHVEDTSGDNASTLARTVRTTACGQGQCPPQIGPQKKHVQLKQSYTNEAILDYRTSSLYLSSRDLRAEA